MSAELDKEGMIYALTDGVGAEFGRASRKSFFQQMQRLEAQKGFRSASVEEQQFLIDLLAMASFYQCVVVPILCSAQFISVLREAGATHLRVAGDKLDQTHAVRAKAATTGFRQTLEKAQIPEHLLQYATLRHFIHSAKRYLQERRE